MMISAILRLPFLLAFVFSATLFAPLGNALAGPKQTTLLLIRHAEKPEEGEGLTPAGEARAKAYVGYFTKFELQSESLKPDEIFAAADSKSSHRPRLTVEPLAHALGLPVNSPYKDRDYLSFAKALQAGHDGKHILVCWHHGAMPEMLQALGADPNTLLPGGHWPGDEYAWVIVLRYDGTGKLVESQRIAEGF